MKFHVKQKFCCLSFKMKIIIEIERAKVQDKIGLGRNHSFISPFRA